MLTHEILIHSKDRARTWQAQIIVRPANLQRIKNQKIGKKKQLSVIEAQIF